MPTRSLHRLATVLITILASVGLYAPGLFDPAAAADAPAGGGVSHTVFDTPGQDAGLGTHVVALTFDDGPDPTWTPQVLEVLRRSATPATFFEIGRQVATYPELSRSVAASGHVVVNHTWSHANLTTVPSGSWDNEVDQTSRAIGFVTGQGSRCLRPPYGVVNPTVVGLAAQRGLATVTWSVDTADYTRPGADVIAARALGGLKDGAILLFHDGGGDRSQTVAALPRIIDGIRARGYRTVSVCGPGTGPEQHQAYGFGTAPPAEDAVRTASPVVGAAGRSTGDGYWASSADGGVFSHGGASYHGSAGAMHLNSPVVGMAAAPDGDGYWLTAADGGVFAFGSATFYGSTGGLRLNSPIVDMAAAPDGGGYWLVAADGGVFAFGSAKFLGSPADRPLNSPVVGITPSREGKGYWLVASDGGVFAYGYAPFYGSAGGLRLNSPIIGMAHPGDARGYWLAAADGGVFSFGSAPFLGSRAAKATSDHYVAIVSAPHVAGDGYWILGAHPVH